MLRTTLVLDISDGSGSIASQAVFTCPFIALCGRCETHQCPLGSAECKEHWMRIRTNNTLERINREIKRRTKVVGTFPDGASALMLVCARLRHVASSSWGTKRYLNMEHLTSMLLSEEESNIAG